MSENQEKQVVTHEVELDDNVFWAIVWAIIASVVITLIISILSYNTHSRDAMVEMVTNGTPAMEASCAIDGYSDSSCVILNTGNAIQKNSQ